MQLCAILMLMLATRVCLAQEQITITTYYPSPQGIYSDLRADRLAVGNNRAFAASGEVTWGGSTSLGRLSNDQGASIELGGTVTTMTPYIDFSRSSGDYDARIIMEGTDRLGIYVRDQVEVRRGSGWTNLGNIEVRDIYLCS